jgi:hypothetical protein
MNFGGVPFDRVRRSMQLFIEDVAPAFKPLPAGATSGN